MTESKQSKLAHYERRQLQRFLQVDGFCRTRGDSVMAPDEDGDVVMLGMTQELMGTPGPNLPVRLLIHDNASPEDVRRLLIKMLDVVGSGFEFLRDEDARELFLPSEIPF
jgi:hypothetical protein